MNNIKALTFDTGGTILDWHSGFKDAFRITGERYNYANDWGFLANELRRRSHGGQCTILPIVRR